MDIFARARDPEGPLVPPPPGVTPIFVNPPNGNATMNTVVSISLALTVSFILIHFSGKIRNKLHVDDFLVIPAVLAFITCHVFIYRITHSTGYFVRGWNIQLKNQEWHLFNIYITTTTYNVCMIFLKFGILVQWARIFTPGKRGFFWWACYTIATLNAIFYLATILIDLLNCRPVQYHFDKTIKGGKCDDNDLLAPLSAGINLLFDVCILILPQQVIWGLNMAFHRKLKVSFVFIAGILCIISAALRLKFAIDLLYANDYAYDASFAVLFGSLEMTFAFLTFALPGAPKPFSILLHHTRNSLGKVASWTGLSRTFTTRTATEANTYHTNDADERGLMPHAKASFSKSEYSELHDHAIPMQGLSQEAKDHAILRTTRFNMSESYITDNTVSNGGPLPQQHPWEPLSRKPEAH